jgi:hypothetical protein
MCLIHSLDLVKGHMSAETGEVRKDGKSKEWHCCSRDKNERMHSFRWRLKKDLTALGSPSTGRIYEELESLKLIEQTRQQIDTQTVPRYPMLP